MKKMIFAIVVMAVWIGWAEDALRVVRNELDWSADVIVVTNRFPQAEESVVSNFFAKGGALVVLAARARSAIRRRGCRAGRTTSGRS